MKDFFFHTCQVTKIMVPIIFYYNKVLIVSQTHSITSTFYMQESIWFVESSEVSKAPLL
jgi:hypothetical protein